MDQRPLPLFAFGNVAVGVIAIGNVAYGVVAIGLSVAVGVVAIGINAVGAVAFGINSLGPIAIGAVNGIGTLAWAGVNALAGHGLGLVNNGTSPIFGAILGVVAMVVAQVVAKPRTPRERGPALAAALGSTGGFTAEARLVRDGDRLALVDGETRIAIAGDAALAGKRVLARVKIVDEFSDTGAYREAPDKHRRYILEEATAVARAPWFAGRNDLDATVARAIQLSAACALAILVADYLG